MCRVWTALDLLARLVALIGVRNLGLQDDNEGLYADVALEMLAGGASPRPGQETQLLARNRDLPLRVVRACRPAVVLTADAALASAPAARDGVRTPAAFRRRGLQRVGATD